jgi:polysaccharide biosynthesis transport protein
MQSSLDANGINTSSPYLAEEEDRLPDVDLHQVLRILRRNAVLLGIVVAAAVVLGIVVTLLSVPRYDATSKVLVEQSSEQIIEGGQLDAEASPLDAARFLQTQVELIESRRLAERVVDEGDLANDARFFDALGGELPEADDLPETMSGADALRSFRRERAAGLLQESVDAQLPSESRIISIKVNTEDAVYSAKLADLYASSYIQSNLSRKFDSSAYARDFLAKQLDEARQRLETSERDLNQYSRAAGLIRVGDSGESGSTELSVNNSTLMQVNAAAGDATAQRIAAEDTWQAIAEQPLTSIPQVLANPIVQDLLRQRSEIERSLAQDRARYLEGHPTVVTQQAQLRDVNSRINTIGNAIKRSVYLDYQAALGKEQSLKENVAQLQDQALNEQDRGVQYNILERVADTNRGLYDSLLQRYNQLNASAGAASNNVSLVDNADVPSQPSSPNLMLNVMLSLLAGILVGVAVVMLREYFDDVVHSPEDVESKLGLPLLGLVPIVDDGDMDVALNENKSSVTEAYSALVTNLMYATPSGLPKVLIVTSSTEKQGKTTTSLAIARDTARLGKRTLLIDADLRRPTLHRDLDDPKAEGLVSVLTGQKSFEDAVVPASGSDHLFYMTALPIPPDPTVLLAGARLGEVLRMARERFDFVVIDTAPMLGLSDTALLATHADGTILMADASAFKRGAIKGSLRRLRMVNANVLGVVLTKFDPRSASGQYGYYGYNYYNYDARGEPA